MWNEQQNWPKKHLAWATLGFKNVASATILAQKNICEKHLV